MGLATRCPSEATEIATTEITATEVATAEVAAPVVPAEVTTGITTTGITAGVTGVGLAGVVPGVVATVPAHAHPGHPGEQRRRHEVAADAPGAGDQRGLPPRLGVPARGTGRPATIPPG